MTLRSRERKRIQITSEQRCSCGFTLWGERSARDIEPGAVVFVRRARVSDFGGRSLDSTDGPVDINPDDPHAVHLRWGLL